MARDLGRRRAARGEGQIELERNRLASFIEQTPGGVVLWEGPELRCDRAEAMQTARELFQTHVLRSAPLLRALGFTSEATLIDSTDFLSGKTGHLVAPLKAVRQQL